jgi:glycosyltransferase involved in cell wall biosynthesis
MRSFVGLVTNSHALAAIIKDDFSMPEEKVLAAPNGAEDLGFVPPPNLNGAEIDVGYVGHLYQGRGIELILHMARACPWARFHIVGGSDDDIRSWTERTAHLNNLLLHGFVPPAEVETFRRNCDVLLAPYQKEVYGSTYRDQADYMSPLKLFEYMASGRAIICSNLPALHEILTGGETTIFCEPEDPHAWVSALEQLRRDSDLRRRLGNNARERFITTFTRHGRATRVLKWAGFE